MHHLYRSHATDAQVSLPAGGMVQWGDKYRISAQSHCESKIDAGYNLLHNKKMRIVSLPLLTTSKEDSKQEQQKKWKLTYEKDKAKTYRRNP